MNPTSTKGVSGKQSWVALLGYAGQGVHMVIGRHPAMPVELQTHEDKEETTWQLLWNARQLLLCRTVLLQN